MLHSASLPFTVELPFEVFHKAGEAGKERRIGGIISTSNKDRQGEKVVQNGLDFSEFVQNGWFNDNHSKDTTGVVGYPEFVKKVSHNGKPAHYVEGYLIEGHGPSDRIWSLAQALQKTKRRLGFSVEGAVTRREGMNGEVIAAAKVRNVAITNAPVNTQTGMEVLAKSMLAMECEGDWLAKALAAGQAIANPGAAPGEGFPLRTESMLGTSRKRKKRLKKVLKKCAKQLSKSEAIAYLHTRYPDMTTFKAEWLLTHIAAIQPNKGL